MEPNLLYLLIRECISHRSWIVSWFLCSKFSSWVFFSHPYGHALVFFSSSNHARNWKIGPQIGHYNNGLGKSVFHFLAIFILVTNSFLFHFCFFRKQISVCGNSVLGSVFYHMVVIRIVEMNCRFTLQT